MEKNQSSPLEHEALGATSAIPAGVAVILLNWNGWKDTIECLESVFRINYPRFSVIVCDNASSDESLDHIRAWAEGSLPVSVANPALAPLVSPPVPKPLKYATIEPGATASRVPSDMRLVLLPTGGNLGFAGGNNVGLRYALSNPENEYFWLLNNDTVIEANALQMLVSMMQADPGLGLCGSVLRDYACPDSVLTLGGRKYDRWTGRTKPILPVACTEGEGAAPTPDYIEAASVLVSRSFLERVGLMNEEYFLYFEEMDWVMRARSQFRFGYSPHSIVYHKEGRSIGSHKDRKHRSSLSDYYQARNRLVFTARYLPWLLPSITASIIGTAIHRLLAGRGQNARAVVRGAFSANSKP